MIQDRAIDIHFYNTLSRSVELFRPAVDDTVRFFVCGPTVYDHAHLGHAKTTVQFDAIVKWLRYWGYDVNYVQNITDVDDKILNRAALDGSSWRDIALQYEQSYLEDMRSLGNSAVSRYARATDFIPQIISQVERLIDKQFAYVIDDGIYYDLSRFPSYGKLSGRTQLTENDSISRIDDSSDKRNWNDFCLWKFRKAGEAAFWEAPFGQGRPGWHIEDTAITETLLGEQYDIHGGAIDLIFPHHEAEITQMESLSGKAPFVRYWLHTGFLTVDQQKMAKSKGNFLKIKDALTRYSGQVLRLLFLSSHYRTSVNFSEEGLEHARNALARLHEFMFKANPSNNDREEEQRISSLRQAIEGALANDFNSPAAIGEIFTFVREWNQSGKEPGVHAVKFLGEIDNIFGFLIPEVKRSADELEAKIQDLLTERAAARKSKNFARSDALRREIEALGFEISDTPSGTRVRRVLTV